MSRKSHPYETAMTIKTDHFSIFGTLFTKKRVYSDEQISSNYVPFLANRQLMSVKDFVFIGNNMNQLPLTPLQHYNTLFEILPKLPKPPFLKFYKQHNNNDEFVQKIANYYKINYNLALDYVKFVILNEKLKQQIEYAHAQITGELQQYMDQQLKGAK